MVSAYITLLGAIFSFGTTRVFCAGYVIVAISFLMELFSGLIAHKALVAIHSTAFAFTEEKVASFVLVQQSYDGDEVGVPVSNADGSATILVVRPKQQHFIQVGHAVVSVVLGVVGGFIAVAFYRRRPKPEEHK